MIRECTRCKRSFTAADLLRSDSKGIESERKAAGLEGVRFLLYHCEACKADDIFIDILPREGEIAEEYRHRRVAMEKAVRSLNADSIDAVVVPVREPASD